MANILVSPLSSDNVTLGDNNQAMDIFRVANPFLQNGEVSGIDTINSSVSYTFSSALMLKLN